MSPFLQRVYALTACIPAGSVATYGQLAFLVGSPRAARAVGTALSVCRDPSVPCHRVVDRFGCTKTVFDCYAPDTQRMLLEAEGVVFTTNGRVDLERCLWQPETNEIMRL